MFSILTIAALLFVIGVGFMAMFVCAQTPAWGNKVAWVLWTVAAILWFVTLVAH